MYKQLRITSSEALGVEIDILLENLDVKEYFLMDDVKSVWEKKIKHMNNHTWPGIDQVRIVVVLEEEASIVIEKLKELKSRIKETLKMRVIITTIDDII